MDEWKSKQGIIGVDSEEIDPDMSMYVSSLCSTYIYVLKRETC